MLGKGMDESTVVGSALHFRRDGLSVSEERYCTASRRQLMWRKFKKHKLALVSGFLLTIIYLIALTAEFWAPYDKLKQNLDYLNTPPIKIRIFDSEGRLRGPFVYGLTGRLDINTYAYTEDTAVIHIIRFFHKGAPYKLLGIFSTDVHFFGTSDGRIFLFGTDRLGRELFFRAVIASRISLSVGLVGVIISFILGCILGGISGYFAAVRI